MKHLKNIKYRLGVLVILSLTAVVCDAQTPTGSKNYIMETKVKVEGITTGSQLSALDVNSANRIIKYFDGIGRPIQSINWKASPTYKDLVDFNYYDPLRESLTFPTYASPTTGGVFRDALQEQHDFYINPPVSIFPTYSTFGEKIYDAAQMIREKGAPGDAFSVLVSGNDDAGHTQNTDFYFNNTTNFTARIFLAEASTTSGLTYQRTLSSPGNFGNQELMVTVSKDENWFAGKSSPIEEYKDKEDRVILKRQWKNSTTPLSTYYVYDQLGNLSFVIPPNAEGDAGVPSNTVLNNLCYQYRYDENNRLIERKIPGKDWEFIVYNKHGQVVATQDGEQRKRNEWLITRYDNQGRITMTGLWNNGNVAKSRADLKTSVYAGQQWDAKDNTQTYGYLLQSYPLSLNTVLKINYYDDYDIINFPSAYIRTGSNRTIGLLTATKVAVLNNPTDMLWNVVYYDDLGRIENSITQHYLGGTVAIGNYDEQHNEYFFSNEIKEATRKHYVASTQALSIETENVFDHAGRITDIFKTINSGTKTTIAKKDYNEIGQLLTKKLHSTNGTTFLQTSDYQYNVRGWLSQVNDPDNITSQRAFGFKLIYNDYSNRADNQYNGNVAGIIWQTKVPSGLGFTQEKQSYFYEYDQLNMLSIAKYTTSGKTDYFNEALTYDKIGNILALQRKAYGSVIDQLAYTYENTNQSNRLASVSDATSSNDGQKSGTANYTYDDNGNMISDDSKSVTIAYNILNLPQTINKTSTSETLTYVYDANGNKLRKVITGNNRDYIAGIEYDTNGSIAFLITEEGRAINNGGAYNYEYMLKDHLGNTRMVIKEDGSVLQTNDYYSFGMEINHNQLIPSPDNLYKYNGKEIQKEFDLKLYDYGARFYDPTIAHFTSTDPKSEEGRLYSNYSYAINNPIRFTDVNGEGPGDRVKAARAMTGARYVQETGKYRTAMTSPALEFKDCSEFVNRVLQADGITKTVLPQNTAEMKVYFQNSAQFIHSDKPKVGDIALWKGHVGIVSGVDKEGNIKLIHARGKNKPAAENPAYTTPAKYRDSEFYGYYRPVKETPDGKLDKQKNKPEPTKETSKGPGSGLGFRNEDQFGLKAPTLSHYDFKRWLELQLFFINLQRQHEEEKKEREKEHEERNYKQ